MIQSKTIPLLLGLIAVLSGVLIWLGYRAEA